MQNKLTLALILSFIVLTAGLSSSAEAGDSVAIWSVTDSGATADFGRIVAPGQSFYMFVNVAYTAAAPTRQPAAYFDPDSIGFIFSDTGGRSYWTDYSAQISDSFVAEGGGISSADTLWYNTSGTIAFLINVGATMDTGYFQVTAYCTATFLDTTSGLGDSLFYDYADSALEGDSIIVQNPASCSFVYLSLGETTGDAPQDTASANPASSYNQFVVRVCVSNVGEGTAMLLADSAALSITNSLGDDITANFGITDDTGNATRLAGGTHDTWSFIITVPDSSSNDHMGELNVGFKKSPFIAIYNMSDSSGVTLERSATADTPTIDIYFPVNTWDGDTIYSAKDLVNVYVPGGNTKLALGTEMTIKLNITSTDIAAAEAELVGNVLLEGVDSGIVEVTTTATPLNTGTQSMVLHINYSANGLTAGEENSIQIFRLGGQAWNQLNNPQALDVAADSASVWLGTLSIFRVMITAPVAGDLSQVRVYPNPYIPYDGDNNTGQIYTGALNTGITFIGITETAEIKIFTLDGTLVDALDANGSGMWQWDGCNSQGRECASGIYFYLVTDSGGGIAKGTLCIIR